MAYIHMDLYSRALQRTVSVRAFIPADKAIYESRTLPPKKPFKTLYLLNGYFGSDIDWLAAGKLHYLATTYNIAVILPSGENKFYVDQVGTGEAFGRFIGEDLVEQTRRIFNLSDKREDTFIAGLSMGGYGALRNGLRYADTFGYVVALSPGIVDEEFLDAQARAKAPGFSESYVASPAYLTSIFGTVDRHIGSDNDIRALYDGLAKSGRRIPKLYLACGSEDMLVIGSVRKLRDWLSERNADLVYDEGPGIHDYNFWNEHIILAAENFLPTEK